MNIEHTLPFSTIITFYSSYLVLSENTSMLESVLELLNCPCHLYGSIHYRMRNGGPFYLVESKVYVDMDLILSQFSSRSICKKYEHAMLRTIYSRKRSSHAGTIPTRAILSHTRPGGQKMVVHV